MTYYEIRKRLILEFGRRLREGAPGVKMLEALEAIGIKIEDPERLRELWNDIKNSIEYSGLVDIKRFHVSGREPYYMDSVSLTDKGRDPENWEDLAG